MKLLFKASIIAIVIAGHLALLNYIQYSNRIQRINKVHIRQQNKDRFKTFFLKDK